MIKEEKTKDMAPENTQQMLKPLPKGDSEEIVRRMKFAYSYGRKTQLEKNIEAMDILLIKMRKQRMTLQTLLNEASDFIYRQLRIREVSIGLRSPKDAKYRYEAQAGMRENVWKAHLKIAYDFEDMSYPERWRGRAISKYTSLFLAEDVPYANGEGDTYDHQIMLKSERKSAEDSREGDYLDTHIIGTNDELLGWIEISGTWNGKLPDTETIKCIEHIAHVLGLLLSCHELDLALKTSNLG
jgi:hypothetical protein